MADYENHPDELSELKAEIERLRPFETVSQEIQALRDRTAALLADLYVLKSVAVSNEKLRAALTNLMKAYRLEFDDDGGRWTADHEPEMQAAARALEQEEPPSK